MRQSLYFGRETSRGFPIYPKYRHRPSGHGIGIVPTSNNTAGVGSLSPPRTSLSTQHLGARNVTPQRRCPRKAVAEASPPIPSSTSSLRFTRFPSCCLFLFPSLPRRGDGRARGRRRPEEDGAVEPQPERRRSAPGPGTARPSNGSRGGGPASSSSYPLIHLFPRPPGVCSCHRPKATPRCGVHPDRVRSNPAWNRLGTGAIVKPVDPSEPRRLGRQEEEALGPPPLLFLSAKRTSKFYLLV